MRHRLDCPQCYARYPSKRIMRAFLLWNLECPACSAPLRFTQRSSVLLGLVAGIWVTVGLFVLLLYWSSLPWAVLVVGLVATHYLSGLLWISGGELEIDRKRQT